MRFSSYFGLKKSQHELDFVDVRVDIDIPLFLDPTAIRLSKDVWSRECVLDLQDFFQRLLTAIRARGVAAGAELMRPITLEPYETHLGVSAKGVRGKGMGRLRAEKLAKKLLKSKAVKSGVLSDLEDTALVVEGIASDFVSDMTTIILRHHLLEYTKAQTTLWGIPCMQKPAGVFWDREEQDWVSTYYDMPVINDDKILLVPKNWVRHRAYADAGSYFQKDVLDFLQAERTPGRSLAGVLAKPPTKKELRAIFPRSKETSDAVTERAPEVLRRYKNKFPRKHKGVSNDQLIEILKDNDANVDVDGIIAELKAIKPGATEASRYEMLVQGILELFFYPQLYNPKPQQRQNEGRRRIDITFVNHGDRTDFFGRLEVKHELLCPYVLFECKNYSEDLKNEEWAQISDRLNPNVGNVGIIVCRQNENPVLQFRRARDRYEERRIVILVLEDSDLIDGLRGWRESGRKTIESLLEEKLRRIKFNDPPTK